MEAQDTGIAGGEELDEDHQPPHTQDTISLVCQTCQTCLIKCSCTVQYTYVFVVEHVEPIIIV